MPGVVRTVGRYEVLRELGRGGMAVVYLARQTDLDRLVALKELSAFRADDPSVAQRFLREARVAGSLTHPNIVTVYDYFEYCGTPYIAMEYVERGSLRSYVGHMTLAQIAGVLEGVLAGLAAAEAHQIVHRDLKPENVMVSADGRVKIADFGIAKAINTTRIGASLTATGTTLGTPQYIAPEQASARDIGPWTDLYSLGCMAFELFVGHAPFHELDAPMAVLLAHVNEPIAPARSLNPEIDEQVSDWIERLLVKDHQQRTQSANQAWDELEEIVITLLGPRWRRSARLLEHPQADAFRTPLTPAAFRSAPQPTSPAAGAEDEDEEESVKWHGAAAPTDADESPAAAAVSPGAVAERRAPAETGREDESAEYESFVWPHPATPVQPDVVSPPPVPEPPPPVPEPPARAEVTAAELPPAPAAGARSALAAPTAALPPTEEPAAALPAQPELASGSPPEPTVAPASPPPVRIMRRIRLTPDVVRVRPGDCATVAATLEGDPITGAEWHLAGNASSFAALRSTADGALIELHPRHGEPPGASSLEVRCLEHGDMAGITFGTIEVLAAQVSQARRPRRGPEPMQAPEVSAQRSVVSPPEFRRAEIWAEPHARAWQVPALIVAVAGCLVFIATLFVNQLGYVYTNEPTHKSLVGATFDYEFTAISEKDTFWPLAKIVGLALGLTLLSLWSFRRSRQSLAASNRAHAGRARASGVESLQSLPRDPYGRLFSIGALAASIVLIGYSLHVHSHQIGSPGHYGFGYWLSLAAAVVVALATGTVALATETASRRARASLSGQVTDVSVDHAENELVVTLRLERNDPHAGRTFVAGVRLVGSDALGFAGIGDWIDAIGRRKSAHLVAYYCTNRTTGAVYDNGPRRRILLALLALLLVLLFVLVFYLFVRFGPNNPGSLVGQCLKSGSSRSFCEGLR